MRAVFAAAVLVLTAAPALAQADALRQARAQGRVGEAWRLAGQLEDEAARARARAEILLDAGSLVAGMHALQEALAHAPDDYVLRWRAVQLALNLGGAERAAHHLELLERSLSAAALEPQDRHAWEQELSTLETRIASRLALERRRGSAISRARGVALLGLALSALALLALLGTRPASGQVEQAVL